MERDSFTPCPLETAFLCRGAQRAHEEVRQTVQIVRGERQEPFLLVADHVLGERREMAAVYPMGDALPDVRVEGPMARLAERKEAAAEAERFGLPEDAEGRVIRHLIAEALRARDKIDFLVRPRDPKELDCARNVGFLATDDEGCMLSFCRGDLDFEGRDFIYRIRLGQRFGAMDDDDERIAKDMYRFLGNAAGLDLWSDRGTANVMQEAWKLAGRTDLPEIRDLDNLLADCRKVRRDAGETFWETSFTDHFMRGRQLERPQVRRLFPRERDDVGRLRPGLRCPGHRRPVGRTARQTPLPALRTRADQGLRKPCGNPYARIWDIFGRLGEDLGHPGVFVAPYVGKWVTVQAHGQDACRTMSKSTSFRRRIN
jgi:hypothetical protein